MGLDLKDYQKLVEPDIDMVLLYENELEIIKPITSYISGCIERNERCIFVYGDTNVDKLTTSLKQMIKLDYYIEKGQLLFLNTTKIFSKSDDSNITNMTNFLKKEVRNSIELGYSGMGITDEIAWSIDYEDGIERIYNYERKINDLIFEGYNVSAIWRYNLNKFSDDAIANIIQLHPYIIYNNKVNENQYYLPFETCKEKDVKKFQVNTWLNNIEKYSNQKLENSYNQPKSKDFVDKELIDLGNNNLLLQSLENNHSYNDTNKQILDVIIKEQNDFIIQSNRKLKQVIIMNKDFNIEKFHQRSNILSYEEFDKVINEFYDLASVSSEQRILSSKKAFDIIKVNKIHSNIFEFNVEGRTVYKQVMSFRYDEDIIYHLASDITDIIEKKSLNIAKLEKEIIEKNEANKAKSRFLARMSHDMRTPLSAIMSLSDFGIEEAQSSTVESYFKKIKLSSEYLLNLFNDILDMQKIEESEIQLRESINSTANLWQPILEMVKQGSNKKNVNICFKNINNVPSYLYYDKNRISQIYTNILSNAVKYSHSNTEVIWENEYFEKDGYCYLKDKIVDFGVGMSEEFQKIMFEPFSTEENNLSKTEFKTGLGLAIVKNLIDIMGGEIYCESAVGLGTTITTIIMVGKVSDLTQYQEKAELDNIPINKSFKGKKVLICEDTDLNAEILSRLLQTEEISIDVATNGLIGSEMAMIKQYDCILMDIRMPIMNGLQAAQRIRQRGIDTPIIAISANAYREDIDQSINAGMNEHMSKPINNGLLLKTLSKYM